MTFSDPIFSRVFFLGGGGGVGGQLLFSIETCGFSRVVGLDLLLPPLDLRMTYIYVSLYKAFKSHKNATGSMFSKDICVHSHLKILCRQNHFLLHSFVEVPPLTTKTALR